MWGLIVGAIIGSIAGSIANSKRPRGCLYNIFAGIVGSWVGERLFGNFGPEIADYYIIPAILGAVIVLIVLNFFLDKKEY